ncbi:hydrolase [Fictibacillus sp. 23RED33]|uniref:hydrolase n=1 Tax=Fictibacillus sp. 23RED33 TaxID=2745879 RepID=UPI0018CD1002|nr:hydrolase [Fictibacillus sp. 23RED33]MBH0172721.1 hydrolase [Fictibacillus sp. 23RED33]
MEKRPYYINVETGEILPIKTASTFQFEISASDEDVRHLERKFSELDSTANDTFVRSHLPYVPYSNDSDNDRYDEKLREAYQMIHDLGQVETRQFIESMSFWNPEKPQDLEKRPKD